MSLDRIGWKLGIEPHLLVDHRGCVHNLRETSPALLDKYLRAACQHADEAAAAAALAKSGLGLVVFEVDILVGGSEHDLLDREAQSD